MSSQETDILSLIVPLYVSKSMYLLLLQLRHLSFFVTPFSILVFSTCLCLYTSNAYS